jgi:hypothetical protein
MPAAMRASSRNMARNCLSLVRCGTMRLNDHRAFEAARSGQLAEEKLGHATGREPAGNLVAPDLLGKPLVPSATRRSAVSTPEPQTDVVTTISQARPRAGRSPLRPGPCKAACSHR